MKLLRNLSVVIAVLAISLLGASSVSAIALTPITTGFNGIIGIDHHAPTNKVIVSVNYPSGLPYNFELIAADGTRTQFSSISGLTDEIKIATAKDDGGGMSLGGFASGEFFTGSGVPGVVVRASADGSTVQNPWVTLPGETGLMRGSLYVDRTGVFGGDLIVATTAGRVWRITAAGVPTLLASLGTHLEGLITVPNNPVKYGPWAGKILIGAEGQGRIYAIDAAGITTFYMLGISPEDFELIPANENFYGVNYPNALLGAPPSEFAGMTGDLLITQESPGRLWRVYWDGIQFQTQLLATVSQWEHVTFSAAGIKEIPPVRPDVSCPGDTTLVCAAQNGAVLDYVVSVSPADPILVCTPPPGSLFPIGTTEVCCIAVDTVTDLADTCCFNVTVEPGIGNIEGCVTADCAPVNLYGVTISAFDSLGNLVATGVTNEGGCYSIPGLPAGVYNVVLETPLGYASDPDETHGLTSEDDEEHSDSSDREEERGDTYDDDEEERGCASDPEEQRVTLGCGATVNVSFATRCLDHDPEPRTIGFWKTNFGKVCGSQPGKAHYSAIQLCGFLDLIAGHFNSNAVNAVVIYVPPASGLCTDKILVAKNLLNLQGSATMLARAKQQLMALLLNVASGKIQQMTVISADGATVSQAVTFCDNLIDNPLSTTADYEKAKTIADKINNSQLVPAGMIPLSTVNIAYKNAVPVSFTLQQNYPNPFNAGTVIPYLLTEGSRVKLEVFDVLGRKVSTLVDGYQDAGQYQLRWNGLDHSSNAVSSGLYFYRLTTRTASEVKKMTLLK